MFHDTVCMMFWSHEQARGGSLVLYSTVLTECWLRGSMAWVSICTVLYIGGFMSCSCRSNRASKSPHSDMGEGHSL